MARFVRIPLLVVAFTLAALLVPTAAHASGTLSIAAGGTYGDTFDGLAATGSDNVTPNGWNFVETATNADTLYAADDGTLAAGNTYSYGTGASTDRAFGGLRSGALVPLIGVALLNFGPVPISELNVFYRGEQWRLGALGRVDRLDAEYSTDAFSLTTGTWTSVDSLDFTAPTTAGTVGFLDGNQPLNQAPVAGSISGLNLANGQTLWIRWVDLNATGSDDGLAIDDFTVSAVGPACTITGTSGDDNLKGTSGVDVICAGQGRDALIGLGGADVLYGEDGNDTLAGGLGNDVLHGGTGTDTATFGDSGVIGTVTADLAAGSSSNAVLGFDTLVEVAGLNTIENLTGGPGDDVLFGNEIRNVLVGEGGGDEIYGGDHDDLLRGVGGNDTLDGGGGNDRIQPGMGDDILPASSGVNTLDYSDLGGTGAGQTIDSQTITSTGFAGTDEIQVGLGAPFANVFGSARDDVIDMRVPALASLIIGGGGDDQIRVDDTDTVDQVLGGAGSDTCLVDATEPEDCEL